MMVNFILWWGVRTEDRTVLFDLKKGNEKGSVRLTVLRSHLEVQKAYTPKFPQVVVYKTKYVPS
jgi:hypothetical protein